MKSIISIVLLLLLGSVEYSHMTTPEDQQTTDNPLLWHEDFEVASYREVQTSENLTYDDVTDQLKALKSYLNENYPKISDDDDIPPPRGSKLMHDEKLGILKLVTKVGLHVHADRIINMDIEKQALSLRVQEIFYWYDLSLQWQSTEYPQIFQIDFNDTAIWTPPIDAMSIVEESDIVNHKLVSVHPDGLCFMIKIKQYKIPCAVNIQDFPFDKHTCSYTYEERGSLHSKIFLAAEVSDISRVGDILLTEYYAHLEWIAVAVNNSIMAAPQNGLNFTIELQRQSRFYSIVLIFPTVLLNLLSLVVFTLPINNTERESFALTLILTYFVLVTIIVDTSPPTGSQIPRLGLYVLLSTVIVVITFGMSLILIELHEHKRAKQRKMSPRLFRCLCKFCCFDQCFKDYKKQSEKTYVSIKEKSDLIDKDIDDADDAKMREEFKWKLLAKVLNGTFLMMTTLAHIVLPVLIFTV